MIINFKNDSIKKYKSHQSYFNIFINWSDVGAENSNSLILFKIVFFFFLIYGVNDIQHINALRVWYYKLNMAWLHVCA